jgi:hypothetical protein
MPQDYGLPEMKTEHNRMRISLALKRQKEGKIKSMGLLRTVIDLQIIIKCDTLLFMSMKMTKLG